MASIASCERPSPRIVAEHANYWHACRDPGEIEWGLGVEPDDLDRFLAKDAPTYLEMGFTQVTLGFDGPLWDLGPSRYWLAWRDGQTTG